MPISLPVSKKNIEKYFVICFLFFIFFQVSLGDFVGMSVRVYYLCLPFVFLLAYRWEGNYRIVFLYFCTLTATTLLQIPFGAKANPVWFLLIASFICWMAGRYITLKFPSETVLNWFEYVAITLLLLIFARTLVTFPELVMGLENRYALVNYPFIAPGGWNVEISFLCFLLILLRGRNIYWWIFGAILALELVFQSRAGILLLFLSVLLKPGRRLVLRDVLLLTGLCCVLFLIVYLVYIGLDGIGAVDRLLDFNREFESYEAGVGRLYTFERSYFLLDENIFGYGVGMGIDHARQMYGDLNDANFHNIFIQIFVEGGIQSLLLLIAISYTIVSKVISGRFNNRFGCVAIAYLVSGMFQFNGYDTIGWLFIGLFYGAEQRSLTCSKNGRMVVAQNSELDILQ